MAEIDPNLDARISELRQAIRQTIDDEIVAAKRRQIEILSHLVVELRSSVSDAKRRSAVGEAMREIGAEAAGLIDLLAESVPAKEAAPDDGQELQLRAKRFARVKVAELQLYQAADVKAGRTAGNLYRALQTRIDEARDAFRDRFLTRECVGTDYLHAELVRTLANDDATILGPDYPGPLA